MREQDKYYDTCMTLLSDYGLFAIGSHKISMIYHRLLQKGKGGIFGKPQAHDDCCEEQARFTLHSHISIWIENFNDIRNLLFHENEVIRQ